MPKILVVGASSAIAKETAKTAVDRAVTLFDAVQPPAGEMPVVLGNGITGVLLHEAIGHGMEADFNRKNISTYSTMLGKKVAEPFVTIIDDGTNPTMLGSINVDDEGIAGQKTVLVDKGILTSYLHDKISAKFYGVKPTGNGRRESYQHYPMPRMRNTYMEAGPATPEDVIKAAGKGIYVEDVSNGHHPCRYRHVIPLQPSRVTGTVHFFVVATGNGGNIAQVLWVWQLLQHNDRLDNVVVNLMSLFVGERAPLNGQVVYLIPVVHVIRHIDSEAPTVV